MIRARQSCVCVLVSCVVFVYAGVSVHAGVLHVFPSTRGDTLETRGICRCCYALSCRFVANEGVFGCSAEG